MTREEGEGFKEMTGSDTLCTAGSQFLGVKDNTKVLTTLLITNITTQYLGY